MCSSDLPNGTMQVSRIDVIDVTGAVAVDAATERARRALEAAVHWLYRHDRDLQAPYDTKLGALLHEPSFQNLLPQEVYQKARLIQQEGNQAVHSNRAIHAAVATAIGASGLPEDAVQLLPTQDRAAVGEMLRAQGDIDMIIPRGGKSLVARVQDEARVPVLAHLDGICHTYIHTSADPAMALDIAVNAKMRRTGICGAMETLLIDQDYPAPKELMSAMIDAGCEMRVDDALMELDGRSVSARTQDWDTEYLEPVLSARLVGGMDDALAHIARHSSGHTEAIIASDEAAAERFLSEVDSAIVMHNTSSQFADGGEFGLGAEIGIATGRLHARGPVALEGLTTYKWVVRGTGQTRP